jgi:hypothetical protein
MPGGVSDGNVAAGAGDGAGGEHTGAERSVHPGKHCTTKGAVLCVVV